MTNELIKLSFTGWNVFLRGSFKQKLIAYVVLGAIEGGTKAFIESATGIRKKRREEALEREKELEKQLEKLKVDVTADFKQQMKEEFKVTEQNIKLTKDAQREIEEILKGLKN